MKTIREAVTAHHGGFEQADNAGIMTLWNSLTEQTRQKYLTAIKEKKVKK